MRYIDLNAVIASIPAAIRNVLYGIDVSMNVKTDAEKEHAAAHGNAHWSPVKQYLENFSNRKCWYTESKNPGCLNDVEHFRPKAKVKDKLGNTDHWYWFLAFDTTNYRLSCHLPNRLNANDVLGETGGKGSKFPLLPGSTRALDKAAVAAERPLFLDPSVEADTDLLEFLPDGRPVISPHFASNADLAQRVDKSKLFLNLDFSTFNEDREKLYNRVKQLVERGDGYFRHGNVALEDVKNDLSALMRPDAEYSKAAECYIRCFRDRKWIEELLFP